MSKGCAVLAGLYEKRFVYKHPGHKPDDHRGWDMQDQHIKKNRRLKASKRAAISDQRKTKRRQRQCEGYTYIEMVGWIDRREILRRDEDCLGD